MQMESIINEILISTKSYSRLIDIIIEQNRSNILLSFKNAFDSDFNILSRIYLNLNINLIKLYNLSRNAPEILYSFETLKIKIEEYFEIFLKKLLNKVKYYGLEALILKHFLSISYMVIMPVSKTFSHEPKGLKIIIGKTEFQDQKVEYLDTIYKCISKCCANKMYFLEFNLRFYFINRNERMIVMSSNKIKNCRNCKSELVKIDEKMNFIFKYIISYQNRYDYIESNTRIDEGKIALTGLTARNRKGQKILKCLHNYSVEDNITNKLIRTKNENIEWKNCSKNQILNNLIKITRFKFPFIKEIGESDLKIFLILNIFKVLDVFESNAKTSFQEEVNGYELSSPISAVESNSLNLSSGFSALNTGRTSNFYKS